MKQLMGRGRAAGALALGMVGVLAAGLAHAIPDSEGVIHACARDKKVRLVEAATDCGGKETHVSWGHEGPQGAPGPVGPQGPQGEPGPAGPSGAAIAHHTSGRDVAFPPAGTGTQFVPVVEMGLPAGEYVVHSELKFRRDGAGTLPIQGQCYLSRRNGASLGNGYFTLGTDNFARAGASTTVPVTMSQADIITWLCHISTPGGGQVVSFEPVVTAVAVELRPAL